MEQRSGARTLFCVLVASTICCQEGANQRQETKSASKTTALAPSPSVDLSNVVRQVHFAFRRSDGGRHVGGHATYGVEASRRGAVEVRPVHHTAEGVLRGAGLSLETVSISRGDQDLARTEGRGAAPPCAGAERPRIQVLKDGRLSLRRSAVEELWQNREAGVEQSFRFADRPRGQGDVVARVAVGGPQRYVGQTPGGLHFIDPASGVGLRYGRAYWVDKSGRRTEVAARYSGGVIELRVPGALVDQTSYPAVLDPVIGPEFGMDQPVHGPPVKSQQKPAIAFDGTNYLVVWQDQRAGTTWDIVGARVSAAGAVLDVEGIEISTATNSQQNPAVVFGGGHFLVVWQDKRGGGWNIYGARVKPDGTVQEPTGTAISTAGGDQTTPAAAYDGTNYFVVWQDKRSGNWDIYGARVSTAGSVVDATGLTISAAANTQSAPAVAHDGTGYLVVWQDYRSTTDYDIFAARVTTAGAVLDPTGVAIAQVTNNQQEPALAHDGTNFLVVWQDKRNAGTKWDIYGTRVSSAAAVLDPFGITVSKYDNDTHDQLRPTVAHDGTNYLVAWHDNRDEYTPVWETYNVYGARVSTAGAVLDTGGNPFFLISGQAGSQRDAAVAFGTTGFLVVWADSKTNKLGVLSPTTWDIQSTTVSPGGAVGTATGVAIATDRNAQQTPVVTHDGTNYLVVWADYRTGQNGPGWDIYGVRVSGTGAVLDPTGIAISTAVDDQMEPAVAYGAGQSLVVWQDRRGGTVWDVYGARVQGATVLDAGGVAISAEALTSQKYPAVTHGGGQFFVAWEDFRVNKQWDIYGARVAAAGTVTDAKGIPISSTPGSAQQKPSVACDGTNYLVVWEDKRSGSTWDIYGARLSTTGSLLDPQGKVVSIVSNHQQAPVVIHDGTNFLVAWHDKRAGNHWDIYAARVDATGLVLDFSGIAVSTAAGDQQAPAVGLDGYGAVLLWQDRRAVTSWDIYGARITSSGVVGDTQGFPVTSAAAFDETSPALAGTTDGRVLVAYRRPEDDTIYSTDRVKARVVVTRGDNGSPCIATIGCKNGHCVDGVCCNTACGGGVTTDCQACSLTAGAAANGVCGPASSTTECRPTAGACDLAETCNGTALTCPADGFKSSGVCRAAVDTCDVAESCTGTSAVCPSDGVKPAGAVCRPAVAGGCDVAETCGGITAVCPVDVLKPDGSTCPGGTCAAGTCQLISDVGVPDAGPVDAGGDVGQLPEAGIDLGPAPEAGADVGPPPEAGADLGTTDLGTTDLAPTADLAVEAGADLSGSEAGADLATDDLTTEADAAVEQDAASADSGPKPDVWPTWPKTRDDGCSCKVSAAGESSASAGAGASLLLLLVIVIRRRRRG